MKKTLAFLALILVFSMLWLAGCDEDKKSKDTTQTEEETTEETTEADTT